VLDTASGHVVAQVPVGASPHQAPLTRDGRWALVPSQGPGELGIVETATGKVAATVPVGRTPHWVTASSDGQLAWVANEGSNDVSVVDLGRRAVIATIAVGNAPRKIAVQPGPVPHVGEPRPSPTASAAPARRTIAGVVYTDEGTRDVRAAADAVLRAQDYSFAPTFLRGRPGQRLPVRVENAASTLHNLTVDGAGVDRDLLPGSSTELVLTFPATGTARFYCKFHSPLGQNGQLVATER
jgi:YVTN family beta-propeller protein